MKGLRRLAIVLGLLLVGVAPAAAQRDGGILYAYRQHAGERAEFDAGYRSHLEWHRTNQDSLPWYGWDVVSGRRLGEFIDGTFGIDFVALDRRVDPTGDAAHAASSFAGHAEPTARWMVRLRRDLGTATSLEDRTPAPMLLVATYRVSLAGQTAFERVLMRLRGTAGLARYAVYESVVGSSDIEYMLMVGRSGFAAFDDVAADPRRPLNRFLADVDGLDVHAHSELWQLRQDLTLLP